MTISLEKIFFSWICNNPKYFKIVEPHFFKNNEIQLVFKIIRTYVLNNPQAQFPKPVQILEMVSIEDKEKIITKDILKTLLSNDISSYDEENFIMPEFKTWCIKNNLKTGSSEIIDKVRSLDTLKYDDMVNMTSVFKEIINKYANVNVDDVDNESLGSDFDDADAHTQDSSVLKVPSGFKTLDHILSGGWDVSTLNILMLQTNGGKSLMMQNFTVNAANLGYNVLYVTLEMSEKKVLKRLGSMRLKIPINEYDTISRDKEEIAKRIAKLNKRTALTKPTGKIITKFFAAGTATTSDIDKFINTLNEKKNIKIDFLVVDYISLIAATKSMGIDNNLYLKGKHLAEGLRAVGAKYTIPVLTGIQVAKDAWNSNDVTLEQVPESKAIAETADVFIAGIRTEEMKLNNKYKLKLLKQRDGDFSKTYIDMDLNPTYLTLENDNFPN